MNKPRYRWYYGLQLWMLSNPGETDTEVFILNPAEPQQTALDENQQTSEHTA